MSDQVDRAADEMRRQVVGAIAQAMSDRVNHEELEGRVGSLEAWVRRLLVICACGFVGGVLLTAFLAVNAHQVFINLCVQRAYLSPTRAAVCDKVFFGDSDFRPGPQVATKPAPMPMPQEGNGE